MTRWIVIFTALLVNSAQAATDLRFCFGKALPNYTLVAPADVYSTDRGYGFDLGSKISSGKPFFFSTVLAPGEYQVTITLGDDNAETIATVKTETRRLMLQAVRVPAGQTKSFTFLVHLRVPQIPGGGEV